MMNWLQNRLGIDALAEKQDSLHREQMKEQQVTEERWKYITQRLSDMHDHLQEMKDKVNTLGEQSPRRQKVKTPSPAPFRPRATYPAALHFLQQILAALPEHSRKPLHYTRLAGRLKCTHGRVSAALSRLKEQGLVERMGQGLYRKAAAGGKVEDIDTSPGSVDY